MDPDSLAPDWAVFDIDWDGKHDGQFVDAVLRNAEKLVRLDVCRSAAAAAAALACGAQGLG
eukprot:1510203-Rhodomonas_salina.2